MDGFFRNRAYAYPSESSTTAIFFNNERGVPCSLRWFNNPNSRFSPHSVFRVSEHLTGLYISSSTRGLALRHYIPTDSLAICNPFLPSTIRHLERPPMGLDPSYILLTTRFPMQSTSPPIFQNPTDSTSPPTFHIVCPIRHGPRNYTFQVCTSLLSPQGEFQWHLFMNRHNLGCEILPHTGISVHRLAFWLTDGPTPCILKFDFLGGCRGQVLTFIPIPECIARSRSLQLGRSGQDLAILLVSEERSTVEMYLFDEQTSTWMPYMVYDVHRFDAASMATPLAQNGVIFCREWPKPLRFDSNYIQALLWVDGQVAIWEGNTVDDTSQSHVRFLTHGERMPWENVAAAIPYTFTTSTPTNNGFILHGHQ